MTEILENSNIAGKHRRYQHDRLDPITQEVPHFLPHPRWRLYIEYIGKRKGQGRLYERP